MHEMECTLNNSREFVDSELVIYTDIYVYTYCILWMYPGKEVWRFKPSLKFFINYFILRESH